MDDGIEMMKEIFDHYRAKTIRILFPTACSFFGGVFLAHHFGGIAAGDKSNHQMTLHIPNAFYLWAVGVALCAPIVAAHNNLSSGMVTMIRTLRSLRGILRVMIVFVLSQVAIHYGTIFHPFVLADNRHFVFYIVKRTIGKHEWARYALVPVYLCCGWLLARVLGKHQGIPLMTLFGIASSLVLIPTPLIEARYFAVPCLLFRLHIVERRELRLALETLIHICVNLGVFYIFLTRTFEWPSKPGVPQRFMW
jgi:alpha-1,2-glucosyltransferase